MSENLAIKTDNPGDWVKKKDRAARDLTPRAIDNGLKSTWAHCEAPLSVITSQIIADPREATCELQALALFILDQRQPSAPRRSGVLGVSLHRQVIRQDLVREDSAAHPVRNYSSTHRSLLAADEQDRRQMLADVFSSDAFKTWRFSRLAMAELLEELLNGDHIEEAFRSDARSLVLEWRS